MTRRGEVVKVFGGLVVVAILVGFTLYALPKSLPPSHVASPDRTWSIVVFASHWETTGIGEGSYKMHVNIQDGRGRVVASIFVGIAPNRSSAERDYTVSFESNEVAHIGQARTIRKSEYFP